MNKFTNRICQVNCLKNCEWQTKLQTQKYLCQIKHALRYVQTFFFPGGFQTSMKIEGRELANEHINLERNQISAQTEFLRLSINSPADDTFSCPLENKCRLYIKLWYRAIVFFCMLLLIMDEISEETFSRSFREDLSLAISSKCTPFSTKLLKRELQTPTVHMHLFCLCYTISFLNLWQISSISLVCIKAQMHTPFGASIVLDFSYLPRLK